MYGKSWIVAGALFAFGAPVVASGQEPTVVPLVPVPIPAAPAPAPVPHVQIAVPHTTTPTWVPSTTLVLHFHWPRRPRLNAPAKATPVPMFAAASPPLPSPQTPRKFFP